MQISGSMRCCLTTESAETGSAEMGSDSYRPATILRRFRVAGRRRARCANMKSNLGGDQMKTRHCVLWGMASIALLTVPAAAQTVKIGFISSYSGPAAAQGDQL